MTTSTGRFAAAAAITSARSKDSCERAPPGSRRPSALAGSASAARNGESAISRATAVWRLARTRTTRDHGRSAAPPAAAGHHVQTTSNPAARSAAASASLVLPMPGSPVTVSSVPRPARAAASAESTSASTPARATSGTSAPMTTPC